MIHCSSSSHETLQQRRHADGELWCQGCGQSDELSVSCCAIRTLPMLTSVLCCVCSGGRISSGLVPLNKTGQYMLVRPSFAVRFPLTRWRCSTWATVSPARPRTRTSTICGRRAAPPLCRPLLPLLHAVLTAGARGLCARHYRFFQDGLWTWISGARFFFAWLQLAHVVSAHRLCLLSIAGTTSSTGSGNGYSPSRGVYQETNISGR